MTHIPGEPLGELMQRLDGTVFSHSGIAVRTDQDPDRPATHLLSALAKDLPEDGALDLGGVRWDPFSSFRPHRDLWCIPMPAQSRRRALEYAARFRPEAGEEGSFSFVKLVTVAAALRAVELRTIDPALASSVFAATTAVAQQLAPDQHRRSYYCAELVANAYGRTFTRA
ncbi:MAG TPA: hypothetical protein VNP37_10465, partial [Actinomycetospora sp.]|nr:hypothetical protein [Actinomycetospora sp.]